MILSKRKYIVVLTLLCVGFTGVTAGKVYAHSVALNAIRVCIKNKNGSMRAVRLTDKCSSTETVFDITKNISASTSGTTTPTPASPVISTTNSADTGAFVDNLVGADFTSADLRYRNLAGRDLSNVRFNNANLSYVNMTNANLIGADLSYANTNGIVGMASTKLSHTNLTGMSFEPDMNLSRRDFTDVVVTGARFLSTDFSNSDLSNDDLTGTMFQNSNLTGVNLAGAKFDANSIIYNVDFTNANLMNVSGILDASFNNNYASATWSNTICPDGTNSSTHAETCMGHF